MNFLGAKKTMNELASTRREHERGILRPVVGSEYTKAMRINTHNNDPTYISFIDYRQV